jgi:membrane-bound lytic murein transglycosylase D
MKLIFSIITFLLFTVSVCVAGSSSAAGEDSLKLNKLLVTNDVTEKKPILKKANVRYPELLENHQQYFIAYVEKFAVSRRAYLMRMHTKSKQFFPKATSILQKYNVPSEFKVLIALESAFNGNAVSSAGAVGYWQLMDDVAKEYGLKIVANQHKAASTQKTDLKKAKTATPKVADKKKTVVPTDDRKHFLKSTHTAARYLRDRMRNLQNDWLLVAASYNWGVGNVWNALDRSGKKNPSFWDIKDRLPAETQAYVMNFIALNVIFLNYEQFVNNQLCFKDEQLPEEKNRAAQDLAKGQ